MQNLNLARKWRPQTFETIIGQDVSVSMLKNGLYQNKLFPVYLFSGQRGCGKTSSARVFGAAINCEQLAQFQQTPKENPVPCLNCQSCQAMLHGQHPDFIEIDAASHTGVEHVRQLIESCAYMPLSGSKKIYLIDEAHMLSKAAFNAFLKILEEPPPSVLFILATTEMHKIPETVRSRCFLALFNPVTHDTLKEHLTQVCTKENINADNDALTLLIRETDGSVRDALNTLERVRFVGAHITQDVVLKTLGKISEQELVTLFDIVLEQKPKALLDQLKKINFEKLVPQNLWNALVQLCRTLLWVKYGVKDIPPTWCHDQRAIKSLAEKCSMNRLHALFQILWSQEELFIRTSQKHAFLENVLLQMAQQVNIADLQDLIKASGNKSALRDASLLRANGEERGLGTNREGNHFDTANSQTLCANEKANSIQSVRPEETAQQASRRVSPNGQTNPTWRTFLEKISPINDPLLISIFKQATFITHDETTKKITLCLNNNSPFFTEKIKECETIWKPPLEEQFSGFSGFVFQTIPPQQMEKKTISPESKPVQTVKISKPAPNHYSQTKSGFSSRNFGQNAQNLPRGKRIDISDTAQWPKANLIVSHFSGTIEKAVETK